MTALKKLKWKSHSSKPEPQKKLTQIAVNQAIMWLCAQPSVAKHIRKLWRNPIRALAQRKPR